MPTTARHPHQPTRRDSWPPTQVPVYHSIEADDADTSMDVEHHDALLEDDPMNAFLTPTPLLDDGDTDDEDVMSLDLEMDLAFDAGIEDTHRPAPTIRSISPSKLGGGRLRPPPPRTPTPPHLRSGSRSPPSRNSPEVTTPNTDGGFYGGDDDDDDDDDYDDGEDYVRLTPGSLSPASPFVDGLLAAAPVFPFSKNLGSSKSRGGRARRAGKAAAVAAARAEEKAQDRVALMMMMAARGSSLGGDDEGHAGHHHHHLLLPSPAFHVGRPQAARDRPAASASSSFSRPHLPMRPRSWSGASGYGSGRLSPRAWREPSPDVWSIEEDVEGEVLSEMDIDARGRKPGKGKGKGKGKRVRFALPVREEIP